MQLCVCVCVADILYRLCIVAVDIFSVYNNYIPVFVL